jgi:hypothetical protein
MNEFLTKIFFILFFIINIIYIYKIHILYFLLGYIDVAKFLMYSVPGFQLLKINPF